MVRWRRLLSNQQVSVDLTQVASFVLEKKILVSNVCVRQTTRTYTIAHICVEVTKKYQLIMPVTVIWNWTDAVLPCTPPPVLVVVSK